MISFSKYHGAGNDFILIDDRDRTFDAENFALVKAMCSRYFGIGSDGLMLLRNNDWADFEMVYYNADGRPGSMCGNGGRCITAFAKSLRIIGDECAFLASDGMHDAKIWSLNDVSLKMSNVNQIEWLNDEIALIDTGSPHYLVSVENLNSFDVLIEGRRIRYSDRFAEKGVNVNFIEVLEGVVHIRTYERGVENETLACGTGITAAAIYANARFNMQSPIQLKALGGNLRVSFEEETGKYSEIWKRGPVQHVYDGNYRN